MSRVRVTDHAVVRYLEREIGIDIESIRDTIAHKVDSIASRKLIKFGGGSRCRIKVDGRIYCLRGNAVTTYIGRKR